MDEARDLNLHRGRDPATSEGVGRLGPSRNLDSPEQVRLELELAGPMSRAFAYSIDYSIVLLAMASILLVSISGLQQVFEWASDSTLIQDLFESLTDWVMENDVDEGEQLVRGLALTFGLWMILEVFMTSAYFVFFETLFAGRTPGKILTHLRVVTESGNVLDWRAALLRNLLRAVDTLPAGYVIGVVSMILSPSVQRLGDIVAGTLVVRERSAEPAESTPAAVVDPDVEAGFRFTRAELAEVGEVERRLIRRTLRRAESLSDRDANQIVGRAIAAISGRIGRNESIPVAEQRDFLWALLQASERLL
jgi:uncharacterized RDD family membrane protein YckC